MFNLVQCVMVELSLVCQLRLFSLEASLHDNTFIISLCLYNWLGVAGGTPLRCRRHFLKYIIITLFMRPLLLLLVAYK